jgi:TGF-beta receptor, other
LVVKSVTLSSRFVLNERQELTIHNFFTDNLDHGMKQTFLLSEIGHWGSNLNFTKAKPIAISEFNHGDDWEKIDIAWPVKNWVEYQDLSHTIQLICETCSGGKLPISNHNDHKPFIVIDTFPQQTVSRQARNVNCGPDSSECCRDSLYIDFKTIGWDDWIIHPKGYNAYFCRGTCNRVASITNTGAHHSTILNVSLLKNYF